MSSSLFEADEPPSLAAQLKPALRALAEQGVYLGTSSWKYEGWLGSIYTPDRYETRRKFSRKKFEAECLREYASVFPAVGGDFSFYQFPTPPFWNSLFSQTPPGFEFGLKVPEEITVARWPGHARYGARGGAINPHFLDASLLDQAFLRPLEPHRDKVAVLMFEFGTFSKELFATPASFFARLEPFLDSLPSGWRYSVEIRNKEYLEKDYFRILARHNVAHTFNAWTRMPPLAEQAAIPEAFTADFTVARALLRHGRTYEQAVAMFEPYRELQEPDESTRESLRGIIKDAVKARRKAYAFVNNRLEGNAPGTIAAIALGAAPGSK